MKPAPFHCASSMLAVTWRTQLTGGFCQHGNFYKNFSPI